MILYDDELEGGHAQIMKWLPHMKPEFQKKLLELELKMHVVQRFAGEDKDKQEFCRMIQRDLLRRQALVLIKGIEPEDRRRQAIESFYRLDAEMRRNQYPELMAKRPEIRRFQSEAISSSVRKALRSATGLTESDPAWLFKLKLEGRSALGEPEVGRGFLDAAKGNTDDFQKAITALSSDPNHKVEIAAIKLMLLFGWMAPENEPFSQSFCYYNDKALGKLVAFLLNVNEYSEKYIRKVWERLGLKKARPLLFRDVEITRDPETGQPVAQPISYQRWAKTDKMMVDFVAEVLRPSINPESIQSGV